MAYTSINKGSDYFNTKLYTGNGTAIGSGGNAITGVGFQPDWTWIKSRTQVEEHEVFDVIRGVTKYVRPSTTQAEVTDSESLTSFDSDGFTVGNHGQVNANGQSFASWNWLAGGTASSNTDGDITSSVSANTTAGFSIVSYTGTGANATVGHGLATTPSCIIVKNRTTVDNWLMYHTSIGNTKVLYLNETYATGTSSAYWNNTSPTSSVFTVGTEVPMNKSGDSIIAYCFAEKKGYSKFGSYTGNGNADGPFIYTGFKPAWVMLKRTDTTGDWQIQDSKRPEYNPLPFYLEANNANVEVDWTSSFPLDFVSNGMKIRNTGTQANPSGGTFIYMAFAESPFTTSTGIPTTAR